MQYDVKLSSLGGFTMYVSLLFSLVLFIQEFVFLTFSFELMIYVRETRLSSSLFSINYVVFLCKREKLDKGNKDNKGNPLICQAPYRSERMY